MTKKATAKKEAAPKAAAKKPKAGLDDLQVLEGGREILNRTARRDGHPVAILRCREDSGEYVVDCDVYPFTGRHVKPLHPGPYRFARQDDATAFVNEAARALAYLGCDVG
jgi:hypothetical protein